MNYKHYSGIIVGGIGVILGLLGLITFTVSFEGVIGYWNILYEQTGGVWYIALAPVTQFYVVLVSCGVLVAYCLKWSIEGKQK